jgi:hypothetical protein
MMQSPTAMSLKLSGTLVCNSWARGRFGSNVAGSLAPGSAEFCAAAAKESSATKITDLSVDGRHGSILTSGKFGRNSDETAI